MKCPFGQHDVVKGVYITEERYIKFAKKRYVDFRPQCEVCTACKNAVVYMYNLKKSHLREKVKECVTVSSLGSRSSEDSYDHIVNKRPKYMTLRDLMNASANRKRSQSTREEDDNLQVNNNNISQGTLVSRSANANTIIDRVQDGQNESGTQVAPTTHALSSSVPHIRISQKPTTSDATITNLRGIKSTKRVLMDLNAEIIEARDSSQASDVRRSQEPSTSKAPYTKPLDNERATNIRNEPSSKTMKRHLVASSDEEDVNDDVSNDDDKDSDWLPSINQINGSRLPHVQPVPKRRPFYHPDSRIMDIYLSGTTGG